MNIVIIGDVHGCYKTFKALVEKAWNPKEDILIQIGDLINKGPDSFSCIKYLRKLQEKYPGQVFYIMGNHEYAVFRKLPSKTKLQKEFKKHIKSKGGDYKEIKTYLKTLPLKWENEKILITHAGISIRAKYPYKAANPSGVLFNRSKILNINKLQVVGHTIVSGHEPIYSKTENVWRIDTGAWCKKYLSSIKLNAKGKLLDIARIKRLDI